MTENQKSLPPTEWPTLYEFRRSIIRDYRARSDAMVLRTINDRPLCFYGELPRRIDLPFAIREARRRGIMPQAQK